MHNGSRSIACCRVNAGIGTALPRDVRVVVHNLFYFGWSDAGHWVRMQGAYDLAQFRRTESAA